MRQISVFQSGVTSDLDYSKLDNNNLVFPTADIRLTNKEGKGLIVTPIKGNVVAFELSDGFLIFGAAEYNGIAYIVSYNHRTGVGEIGSFPSPRVGGGFEETYKPLRNLYLGRREDYENTPTLPDPTDMRSDIFGFDLSHPIGDQIIAMPDYDGTVNLIFTDGKNRLRLVNSGFNQEGEYKINRNYWEGELNESIQLIKPIPKDQKIEYVGLGASGQLKHGNYFFFFRYLDQSNNSTVFIGESSPISLYETSTINRSYRVGGNGNTSKSIVLNIPNIDTSYTFVEFCYIRFFSDSSDIVLSEVQRVAKLFPVPATGDLQAEITGFETIVPFTLAAILEPVNTETICESIISHDRMLWGGNWKREEIDIEMLKEAALQIQLGCDVSRQIPISRLQDYYASPENIQYAGYFRGEAYSCKVSFKLKNGYETEAFPVKGIDARSIAPSNIFNSYTNSSITNDRGIIILPQLFVSPFLPHGITRRRVSDEGGASIMAITFNVNQLRAWAIDKQWFNDNVSEIIFLRAERRPNLMYQGVSTRVYGRSILGRPDTQYNNVSIPIIIGQDALTNVIPFAMPTVERRIDNRTDSVPDEVLFTARFLINWQVINQRPTLTFSLINTNQSPEEQRIRAVFSPDYIFGDKTKIRNAAQPWIQPNHQVHNTFTIQGTRSDGGPIILPNINRWMLHHTAYIRPNTMGGLSVQATNYANVHNPNEWIYPDNPAGLRLVNRARDAARNGGIVDNEDVTQSLFYRFDGYVREVNRNIQVPPYFGFELSELNMNDNSLSSGVHSVNVYRDNPDGDIYFNMYNDELNIPYFKIRSDNLLLEDLRQGEGIINCYQGDAFIQTTVIKTRTWFPTEEAGTNKAFAEREPIGASISHHGYGGSSGTSQMMKYAHGELTEILTENAVNAALRIKTENENTFFPLIPNIKIEWDRVSWGMTNDAFSLFPYSPDVIGWEQALGTGIESFMVNFGNSVTLSQKSYLPNNPNIPKGDNKFPNRIRFTGRQEPGFPVLAYRMWPYNSKRDFENRHGDMVRLCILYGRLLSIQRNSILLHFTHQEETVPTSSGEMIIGVRSILSQQPLILAEYGSQHKFGIVLAKTGLYGWDWINGVIWKVEPSGQNTATAIPIDKTKMIETYVKDLKARVDGNSVTFASNIVRGLDDNVFTLSGREGIISAYDIENNEILLNVFWVTQDGSQRNEILRYSEDIDTFIGTSHYPVNFFFKIQSDLYATAINTNEMVYLQNKGVQGNFFGQPYSPVFSFIVNGTDSTRGGSGGSMFFIDKHFQAMEIESPRTPFPIDKVEFQTMFQRAENNPLMNTQDFWITPEYLLSKWAFPINVATSGEEIFLPESDLRGKWLKVTVTINHSIDTFIKNIITIFTTSKA